MPKKDNKNKIKKSINSKCKAKASILKNNTNIGNSKTCDTVQISLGLFDKVLSFTEKVACILETDG